jgi:hypothetical protein
VKNNILWVDRAPIASDGPFIEENNILWSTDGNPALGFSKSLSTKVINPGFANAAANDFRLVSTSPAREAGSFESVTAGYVHDLDLVAVPQSTLVDVGAYEAVGSAAPTPTPLPIPSPTPTPTPPPTPSLIATCSISVNGGAIYTGDAAVQVKANVPDAAQFMVGTDAGFTGATWQPYQADFGWTLPDTGGRIATLLVYTRFSDASGTPLCGGSQISDDIIYDPVPPTVTVAVASAAATQSGDAASGVVSLSIDASDQENGSGVTGMQISLDGTFSEPEWQPFTPSIDIDTGDIGAGFGQTLYIRVQDGSGNISPVASVLIPGQAGADYGLFIPHISR